MAEINNPHDLLKEAFCTTLPNSSEDVVKNLIARYLYKFTDCGANITFNDDNVIIGSIVEGAEVDTNYHTLVYPFTKLEWDDALSIIESEATELWYAHNTDPLTDHEYPYL